MGVQRGEEFNNTVRKALIGFAVVCMVIAVGTFGLVKLLGLDSSDSPGPSAESVAPVTPLPSSALPGEEEESDSYAPSDSPSESASAQGLSVAISPQQVRAMERINITGDYTGQDATQLRVQRFENGTWSDFPTQATVRNGTFSTYVMTGRLGENKFRVFDPKNDKASNAVSVSVQ